MLIHASWIKVFQKEKKYGLVNFKGRWYVRNYRRTLKSGRGLDLFRAVWECHYKNAPTEFKDLFTGLKGAKNVRESIQ